MGETNDNQPETRSCTSYLVSSKETSSRLAEGGEWPTALTDTESVLYWRDRSRSNPEDSEVLLASDPTDALLLEADRENVSSSYGLGRSSMRGEMFVKEDVHRHEFVLVRQKIGHASWLL